MSAAVPDPRLRDQLAQLLLNTSLRSANQPNSGAMALEQADALMPAIAAEVEARVQAAANQRAVREQHALRYRRADTGTLYDCACGDFTEAAELTDEDHRRVYEAHAAHIAAALGIRRVPARPAEPTGELRERRG